MLYSYSASDPRHLDVFDGFEQVIDIFNQPVFKHRPVIAFDRYFIIAADDCVKHDLCVLQVETKLPERGKDFRIQVFDG